MNKNYLAITNLDSKLSLEFFGEFNLYNITTIDNQINEVDFTKVKIIDLNFSKLEFLDTAAALYINSFQKKLFKKNLQIDVICSNLTILDTLALVKKEQLKEHMLQTKAKKSIVEIIGVATYNNYLGFLSFISFLGEMFATKIHYLMSYKNIRFKEIAFELNESMVKAFGIIALTSFLIGLVVAYQSAYQLKIYGANIFIVDMLGISILRELAPLITAIVIAGRSGSAFTA